MGKKAKPCLKTFLVLCALLFASITEISVNAQEASDGSNNNQADYPSNDSYDYYSDSLQYDPSQDEAFYGPDIDEYGPLDETFPTESSYDYSSYGDYGISSDDDYSGYAPQQPVYKPLDPAPPIKIDEKVIRLGRIPFQSLREMMTQAVPMLNFIKKETGAKGVRLVSSKSYTGVIEALIRGKIDFAWISPAPFISRGHEDHLTAVAKAKFDSKTSYHGVFITHKAANILGIDEVKGRSIGFVDPESTSGYIYPLYLLRRLLINPHKHCSSVTFFGSHDAVLKAVLTRKVDVGVCLEAALNRHSVKNFMDQLLVLAKTDEIPSDVVICREDCPSNLREAFVAALLKVSPETVKIQPTSGSMPMPTFLEASDAEFEPVRAIFQAVEHYRPEKK